MPSAQGPSIPNNGIHLSKIGFKTTLDNTTVYHTVWFEF